MTNWIVYRGPNGSGKTSNLRSHIAADSMKSVGYLDQGNPRCVTSSTVLGNLLAPLVYTGLSLKAAYKEATGVLEKLSQQHLIHQTYGSLSGGERQAVAFLSAVIGKPRKLLLDSPVSMLDIQRRTKLVELIRLELKSGLIEEIITTKLSGRKETIIPENVPENCIDCYEFEGVSDSFHRVRSTIDDIASSATKTNYTLNINDLRLSVPGGRTLIDRACFSLRGGEITLLTGSNGSGKSQLFATITGARPPNHGTIQLVPIESKADTRDNSVGLKKVTRLIPQMPSALLRMKPLKEAFVHTAGIGLSTKTLLNRMAEAQYIDIAKRPYNMSFGERRFAACFIASISAFLDSRIGVIALDEPDAGLDGMRASLLSYTIAKLSSATGKVVVVSTHSPELYREYPIRHMVLTEKDVVEQEAIK